MSVTAATPVGQRGSHLDRRFKACCSTGSRRPASWSTTAATSSTSTDGPVPISNRPRANRATTSWRWPAKGCRSSLAAAMRQCATQRHGSRTGRHPRQVQRRVRTHRPLRGESSRTGSRPRPAAGDVPPHTAGPAGNRLTRGSQSGHEAEERRSSRTTRARTAIHQGIAPNDARRIGNVERGTQVDQRGTAIDERGTAKHQRRTGNLEGRDAVTQRRADDRQRRTAIEGGRSVAGQRRHAEPAQQHRHRHGVPRQRAEDQAVHRAGDRNW